MSATLPYQLVLVNNTSLEDQFIHVQKEIHRNNPDFVAALDNDIRDTFNPAKNTNFSRGEAVRWMLMQGEKAVGRIAAFYKKETDGLWGGIGFFEAPNNQQAANMLLDEASKWLRSKGCTYMDGPVNFGERDKFWGLLVKGFERPSYQENYNPPYYQTLFETYGFTKNFEQHTSEITTTTFKYERFKKLSDRVFANPAYRYEHYRDKDLKRFAADFIYIYNKAWASRKDFVPMTTDKVETTLRSIRPIMVEKAIWFVYANNEPAGFYINVTDVNQIFRHLHGRMDWWGKLKFLWYRATTRIDRIRGIVFGVIPEYQNLGLETGLIMSMYNAMTTHHPEFRSAELAWVGDFNPKMLSLFEALGAETSKIHYTYRRELN